MFQTLIQYLDQILLFLGFRHKSLGKSDNIVKNGREKSINIWLRDYCASFIVLRLVFCLFFRRRTYSPDLPNRIAIIHEVVFHNGRRSFYVDLPGIFVDMPNALLIIHTEAKIGILNSRPKWKKSEWNSVLEHNKFDRIVFLDQILVKEYRPKFKNKNIF